MGVDLRCPVGRPVASCRKCARQQSFESRSHGLSLKLYARSCPGSFEGGSCRYHTVFYLLGDRLRGRALDAPFVEVFDAREHAWPCIRYKGKGGVGRVEDAGGEAPWETPTVGRGTRVTSRTQSAPLIRSLPYN